MKRHALKAWDKQRDNGGVVLVPYESGPGSDPEDAGSVAGIHGQVFDRPVCAVGEHRQVRQVVQAGTGGAAPAVVGAVEAREGDGEEGPAIGLACPDGGLAGTDAEFFRRGVFLGVSVTGKASSGVRERWGTERDARPRGWSSRRCIRTGDGPLSHGPGCDGPPSPPGSGQPLLECGALLSGCLPFSVVVSRSQSSDPAGMDVLDSTYEGSGQSKAP